MVSPVATAMVKADGVSHRTRCTNVVINPYGGSSLENCRAALSENEMMGVALTLFTASVIAIAGDVTDAVHREALVEAAVKKGGLDALVNSASILGPSPQPPLLEYPLDVLERVYRTNVIAPLALIQVLRHQLKPGACLINITSDAGRVRRRWSSCRIFWRLRILHGGCIGLIREICVRRCTRRRFRARISVIARCRR